MAGSPTELHNRPRVHVKRRVKKQFSFKETMAESTWKWDKSLVNPAKSSTADIIGIMNDKILKLDDVKEVHTQYERYRMIDAAFGISTIIPIILAIIALDIEFYGSNPGLLEVLLQACVWITLLSIILDVMRFIQKLKYKKAINKVAKERNLFTSGHIWFLLAEIIALVIVPNPWTANVQIQSYDEDFQVSFYFYLNDVLTVIMMIRILFVVRMILLLSRYMSPTVVRLSYFFGTRNSYMYACKCFMRRHPIKTVIVNYFGSTMIFAYMIKICERPLSLVLPFDESIVSDYWNAVWYVVVTMTTVGYGDFYAHTNFGRLVSFFCCTWGALIISLLVVVFTNILEMDSAEQKILIIMERLQLRKKLKVKAAIVIQSVARFIFAQRIKQADEKQLESHAVKVRNNVKKFKKIHMKLKALNDRENTNEEMSREFEWMRYEMREIKQTIMNITSLAGNKPSEPKQEQFLIRTESDSEMIL